MSETDTYAREYFDAQATSNQEFWNRFGARPDVAGARVLEVGCGHGAMAVELALAGASVVAVDLDTGRIDFAQRNLRERFPQLTDHVQFAAVDVAALSKDRPFDFIVSKDTFEHVQDVATLLSELSSLLKPGGSAFIGYSPLYYSPYGDHGRTGLKIPWAHAVIPRRLTLAVAAKRHRRTVHSLMDIGLNAYTPQMFRDAFAKSPLEIVEIRYNQGEKRLLKLLTGMRLHFPALERFATVSMYVQFRRPPAP